MHLTGFEPTIPAFKRAKTFHALDRAATVTGRFLPYPFQYIVLYHTFIRRSVIWDTDSVVK
jgi:hypothetical protein